MQSDVGRAGPDRRRLDLVDRCPVVVGAEGLSSDQPRKPAPVEGRHDLSRCQRVRPGKDEVARARPAQRGLPPGSGIAEELLIAQADPEELGQRGAAVDPDCPKARDGHVTVQFEGDDLVVAEGHERVIPGRRLRPEPADELAWQCRLVGIADSDLPGSRSDNADSGRQPKRADSEPGPRR